MRKVRRGLALMLVTVAMLAGLGTGALWSDVAATRAAARGGLTVFMVSDSLADRTLADGAGFFGPLKDGPPHVTQFEFPESFATDLAGQGSAAQVVAVDSITDRGTAISWAVAATTAPAGVDVEVARIGHGQECVPGAGHLLWSGPLAELTLTGQALDQARQDLTTPSQVGPDHQWRTHSDLLCITAQIASITHENVFTATGETLLGPIDATDSWQATFGVAADLSVPTLLTFTPVFTR